MKRFELLKSSFATLKSNGRRSFLTMFGIIIGIAAVITIMSLGNGFEKATIESLSESEDGSVSQAFDFMLTDYNKIPAQEDVFSEENIQHIESMPAVKEARVKSDQEEMGYYLPVRWEGSEDEDMLNSDFVDQTTDLEMVAGRPLTSADSKGKKPYLILSDLIVYDYFDSPQSALHQSLRIDGTPFTIVGIFIEPMVEPTLDLEGPVSPSFSAYLPAGSIDRINPSLTQTMSYQLQVFFYPEENIQQLSQEIHHYLQQHGAGLDFGEYSYYDSSEMMEEISKTLGRITLFISAVAGISLFIAGVGVMNMMYISVSERSKEIGIRRALGATKQSILTLFLFEGLVITSIGGWIGYGLGIGLAQAISRFLPFAALIDLKTALIAVAISAIIGVVFSVFPAQSAANKNVIDILR